MLKILPVGVSALLTAVCAVTPSAWAGDLPDHGELRSALQKVVTEENGGL